MTFMEFWHNLRRDLRDDLRDLKERGLKFDDYATIAVFVVTNIYVWFVIYPKLLNYYCL